MTPEDRLTHVEIEVKNIDVCISILTSVAERQQSLLEEVKRDAAMTQRLWVRLAKRYGWLEEGDWPISDA